MSKRKNKRRNDNRQPQAAAAPVDASAPQDEFTISGSVDNDGTYTAAEPVPVDEPVDAHAAEDAAGQHVEDAVNFDALTDMDTIARAAEEIARIKPARIRLRNRYVLVDRPPAERFEKLLPDLLNDFGPYIGLTSEGKERPPKPANLMEWVRLLLKHYPKISDWLVEACCREEDSAEHISGSDVANLFFDEKLLLLGACLSQGFARNGGIRVFFGGGIAAARSAALEELASRS